MCDTSLHTRLFTLKILRSVVVPKLVKTSILGFGWGREVGLKSSSRFYRQAFVAGPHQLQCHELTHRCRPELIKYVLSSLLLVYCVRCCKFCTHKTRERVY